MRLEVLGPQVSAAVRQEKAHAAIRAEAAELALRLAEVPGTDALKADLRAIDRRESLAAARERVTAAAAAHRAELDRGFVVQQTADALRELGYELDEDFEVLASAGERAVVHRPDLPAHGMQVVFPDGSATMLTKVVAVAETTVSADLAAEEITCQDVGRIRAALLERGVTGEATFQKEPGAVPVERVEIKDGARRARSRAARRREQGRQL